MKAPTRRLRPSRSARPPIPPNQRHRDRKNDHQRAPKHPLKDNQ